MKNSKLIEALLEYDEHADVVVDNFEDEDSGTDVINVVNNKPNVISLQIHGDSKYLNTVQYTLYTLEHKILNDTIEELLPLMRRNPQVFKQTKLPTLLKSFFEHNQLSTLQKNDS